MALTVVAPYTPEYDMAGALSNAKQIYASIQGDVAYPSGGYAVAPSTFGLTTRIVDILISTTVQSNTGYQLFYDGLAGTLRFLSPQGPNAAAVEIASGTNISAAVLNAVVIGW